MTLETAGWIVLSAPLVGAVTIGLLWRYLKGVTAGIIGTLAVTVSFAAAIAAVVAVQDRSAGNRQVVAHGWSYAHALSLDADISLLLDPLSIYMACIISGVSALIHLYAIGYMVSDKGYRRFFSYLNFFVFSMLLLVLASNFVMLIVGWAFVGAASYLLISFWYRRSTATAAGIKAFVMNVIGDIGLVLGAYFIFRGLGSVDFLTIFSNVKSGFAHNDAELVAGCICLLVGAFAKSAQVPLHTWLPDAMEGPTPVSALIHAATMVTAGVYLIARMHPLFEQAPHAATVGAIAGCVTLLIAATIGLVVTDLKRIIAYSTMSQIGYMIMAVSAGAYSAGLFHLMTHAFFKALLFMAAGSVIAAMANSQSIDKMSGFKRVLPFTFMTTMVGGLALSGVPPFSGFFSKDEIISTIAARGGMFWILAIAGYVGAILTAIYTFRMIFRVFYGKRCEEAYELSRGRLVHTSEHTNPATGEAEDTDVGFPGAEHHVAERTVSMKLAMTALALLALTAGILQIPKVTNVVDNFLHPTFANSVHVHLHPSNSLLIFGLAIGTVIALSGIAIAYSLWVKKPAVPHELETKFRPLHSFFVHRWYFDELYTAIVIRPFAWLGRATDSWIERYAVRGATVSAPILLVRTSSALVRYAQSGLLRVYAGTMVIGMIVVLFVFVLS